MCVCVCVCVYACACVLFEPRHNSVQIQREADERVTGRDAKADAREKQVQAEYDRMRRELDTQNHVSRQALLEQMDRLNAREAEVRIGSLWGVSFSS